MLQMGLTLLEARLRWRLASLLAAHIHPTTSIRNLGVRTAAFLRHRARLHT